MGLGKGEGEHDMGPANVEESVGIKVEEDGEQLTIGKAVESGQGADMLLMGRNRHS